MRSPSEIQAEIEASRAWLAELEVERQLAEKDAANPRKKRIRDRYLVIQRMLKELNEMGEGIGDDGYALHIKGRTFEIHPETGFQEI